MEAAEVMRGDESVAGELERLLEKTRKKEKELDKTAPEDKDAKNKDKGGIVRRIPRTKKMKMLAKKKKGVIGAYGMAGSWSKKKATG